MIFGKKQDRQQYLYNVFYALDITIAYSSAASSVYVASAYIDADVASAYVDADAAIDAAGRACQDVETAANAAARAYADASASIDTSAVAVDAAARATRASASAVDAASNRTSRISASSAAYRAASASSAASSAYNINNFESNILTDIYNIKERGKHNTPIDMYGKVWNNFLKALEKEKCEYWGRLYQNIFENGFKIERKALKRRLNVPIEIRAQGAVVVANYLEELEKGAKRLNEARIIILGEKGAGKTCLARRLVKSDAPMTKMNESTKGVDTTLWELEKEEMNIRIWDFAGHVVTHAVHQFFLSERCLYIMVYDGRTEERNRLEYWLNHMKNYGGDSKAIILVNKRDGNRPDIEINNLKEKYSITKYFEFSIQDDQADLEVFRNYVASYIKENTTWNKLEIPTSYYNVKEELEKLFFKCNNGKGLEHIPKEKFFEIANKYKVKDNEKLLKDLHFLGVSLWYEEMGNYNTMVLNPEWISDGVYTIINWVHNAKKYLIKLEEFIEIFKDEAERYPEDKHRFLFNLIKHYELAYETEQGNELIIPHLLGKDKPVELPIFLVGESLMLRYKAEQPLPPNTISRFIVRHNKQIKKENSQYLVWRYGVVLKDDKGSTALIREEDRTISVSVKGSTRTSYISALRETLNKIFDSYKSEKPELEYRIEQLTSTGSNKPIWISEEIIQNHYRANKNVIYDSYTNQHIPIQVIIETLNINIGSIISAGRDIDNSTNNTFNFQKYNISLQGNLNELAGQLAKTGNYEEAKELQEAAETLELAEELQEKKKVVRKGVLNSVKRFLDDLEDENSKLHKTVKGIKRGVSIAQDIAKGYNDIAQWAGLPQVPRPFLR